VKYLIILTFMLLFVSFNAFCEDILSAFNQDQKVILTGYAIMLKDAPDTMDNLLPEETKELKNILVMNDNEYQACLDDLKGKMKKTVNPIAVNVRYDLLNDFKASLDITGIEKMADALTKNGGAPYQVYTNIYGMITNFCKNVNGGSKYLKYQENLENIVKLIEKLSNAPNIQETIYKALLDETVKKYILAH